MEIPFIKMQGCGNDYVYLDLITNPELSALLGQNFSDFVFYVSDRHFGIGSDGVVLIMPSDRADCRMRMFNADGSEAQMCGNAARCIGKYAVEHGIVNHCSFSLETQSGLHEIIVNNDNTISVNMGIPQLHSAKLKINEDIISYTFVNIGNPHSVIFTNHNLSDSDFTTLGQAIEHHPFFSEGTNVEFVQVLNKHELNMRVWERGTGETLACGSGACAAFAAARSHNYTSNAATIHLKGGNLQISEDKYSMSLWLTGSASEVFSGTLNYNQL